MAMNPVEMLAIFGSEPTPKETFPAKSRQFQLAGMQARHRQVVQNYVDEKHRLAGDVMLSVAGREQALRDWVRATLDSDFVVESTKQIRTAREQIEGLHRRARLDMADHERKMSMLDALRAANDEESTRRWLLEQDFEVRMEALAKAGESSDLVTLRAFRESPPLLRRRLLDGIDESIQQQAFRRFDEQHAPDLSREARELSEVTAETERSHNAMEQFLLRASGLEEEKFITQNEHGETVMVPVASL